MLACIVYAFVCFCTNKIMWRPILLSRNPIRPANDLCVWLAVAIALADIISFLDMMYWVFV